MNDYFDNENWKFFISEDGTQNIFLHDEEISLWNFGEYYLENKEDAVSLKKYLSNNNIQYTEGTILEHTTIQLTRDFYEEEEHKPLYTGNEYFQLIQKIKEDTRFTQGIYVLANTTITEREFDIKNQSSRHKNGTWILESEKTEGFLGRKV